MKRFLITMGWINEINQINWLEILIDVIILTLMSGLIILMAILVNNYIGAAQ